MARQLVSAADLLRGMQSFSLYRAPSQDCSYLDGEESSSLFIDPALDLDANTYQALLAAGFRRSGPIVYQPGCNACHQCTSLRLPVDQFKPNRSQNRIAKKTRHIQTIDRPGGFVDEHFQLFRRYQQSRHQGEMAKMDEFEYEQFLFAPWSNTRSLEFRDGGGELLAVAITDHLPNAHSAVYTFFEPQLEELSLGVLAVLRQISDARSGGVEHLYLGYWIAACQKMAYKINYMPCEIYRDQTWQACANSEQRKLLRQTILLR
jgi:arginine-tRNA-protein transferase